MKCPVCGDSVHMHGDKLYRNTWSQDTRTWDYYMGCQEHVCPEEG